MSVGLLQVATLLLQHWDVLGVAETDLSPGQEYTYEAQRVADLLDGGGGVDDIALYLKQAAATLGVIPDASRDQAASSVIWASFGPPAAQ